MKTTRKLLIMFLMFSMTSGFLIAQSDCNQNYGWAGNYNIAINVV